MIIINPRKLVIMEQSKTMKARARIKNHIRSRGGEYCFEVTENMLMFWFRELNKAIFQDQLPLPTNIKIYRYKETDDMLGYCSVIFSKKETTIGICEEFDDRKTFLTVLAHEMVHLWQAVARTHYPYARRMTHGKSFYEWEDTIKRTVGLPLGEYIEY